MLYRHRPINYFDLIISRYRSRDEVGSNPLTDELHFSVTDSSGNKLENQLLTITITPGENQPPVVSVGNGITVCCSISFLCGWQSKSRSFQL